MNFLFVHRDFPGQFGALAERLAQSTHHRVAFVTSAEATAPGIDVRRYRPRRAPAPSTHHYLHSFEASVLNVISYSLISIPVFSEKLIENKNLQNQPFEENMLSNTWSVESVDTFGDVGVDTDITVTSDNTVFISYYDIGKKDLKCARLTNNEWNVIVVDSEGDVGRFTSLAFDSLSRPHISYYDATLGVLKHTYFNGIEWIIMVVDSGGNVGLDTSIAIDSADQIHISYHDETNGDLKYARSADNGWDIEVVDSVGDTGEILFTLSSVLAEDKRRKICLPKKPVVKSRSCPVFQL